MKSEAFHADGSGFIFRGSLKYARSSTGVLTLVGADIPSGMLTPGGSCFMVKDHLGSIVYEVNMSTGAFADGSPPTPSPRSTTPPAPTPTAPGIR